MDETVWVGCDIICTAEVADDLRRDLMDAIGDLLTAYTDEEIIDYGVG